MVESDRSTCIDAFEDSDSINKQGSPRQMTNSFAFACITQEKIIRNLSQITLFQITTS